MSPPSLICSKRTRLAYLTKKKLFPPILWKAKPEEMITRVKFVTLIDQERGMPRPKTRRNVLTCTLKHPDKGWAVKVSVICNSFDVKPVKAWLYIAINHLKRYDILLYVWNCNFFVCWLFFYLPYPFPLDPKNMIEIPLSQSEVSQGGKGRWAVI